MSAGAILVTGGAGYVGAHTCKALHRAGYFSYLHIVEVRLFCLSSSSLKNTRSFYSRFYQVSALVSMSICEFGHENIKHLLMVVDKFLHDAIMFGFGVSDSLNPILAQKINEGTGICHDYW